MNKELQKKLSKYSAAAVALVATSASANAQIVYTLVNKTINQNGVDSVDINADGTFDIAMVQYNIPAYQADVVLGGPINSQGHAMAGSSPSSYPYPFVLNGGDQVNTQQFLGADSLGTFTIVVSGTNPYSSFWNGGVTDGYLGVKLNVSGNTHYGWIRMDMTANAQSVTIKDMAYNTAANGAIQAGEGTAFNLDEFEKVANSIWVSERTLYADVKVDFITGTINLMDVSGRAIESFALNTSKQEFDVSHLPAGTYILSMELNGNVYNKKVVIQ